MRQQAPDLYRMTQQLVQRANLPMPKLYIVNDPSPNAFATGRNPSHAVVAVNTGLLNLLNPKEIEGRHRARTGTRRAARHADDGDRRHARGRADVDGANRAVRRDVWHRRLFAQRQ